MSGYGVVLADPAWRYRNFTDSAHGAAASAYDTMDTKDIAAIPVHQWAAKDSVLVLWGTWPKLPDGLRVMEAWGFDYVTAAPWVKTTPSKGDIATGVGFWFQSASEIILIGKRGKPSTQKYPILGLLHGEPAQFYAPAARGKNTHSKKPLEIHDWIEARCPEGGPYLELFARRPREGWATWGLELGVRLSAEGAHYV